MEKKSDKEKPNALVPNFT